MKCTRIYYEKCFNLGNYQNEKVGVEIELAEGETATQALDASKKFVEKSNPKSDKKLELNNAKHIIEHKDSFSYNDVVKAQSIIDKSPEEDDLPF